MSCVIRDEVNVFTLSIVATAAVFMLHNSYVCAVMKVVVLGPPCSGKRTMSKMICSKLRTAHLSPDSIIEDADKPLREEAERYRKNEEVEVN